jgi:hypothetical protein
VMPRTVLWSSESPTTTLAPDSHVVFDMPCELPATRNR